MFYSTSQIVTVAVKIRKTDSSLYLDVNTEYINKSTIVIRYFTTDLVSLIKNQIFC